MKLTEEQREELKREFEEDEERLRREYRIFMRKANAETRLELRPRYIPPDDKEENGG